MQALPHHKVPTASELTFHLLQTGKTVERFTAAIGSALDAGHAGLPSLANSSGTFNISRPTVLANIPYSWWRILPLMLSHGVLQSDDVPGKSAGARFYEEAAIIHILNFLGLQWVYGDNGGTRCSVIEICIPEDVEDGN